MTTKKQTAEDRLIKHLNNHYWDRGCTDCAKAILSDTELIKAIVRERVELLRLI